ncbi:unnamed protein product [Paramecium sonneborni]|uniref:Uncharacterized protein n=1 Tax=Paramecium sonneborni TaxID=65129 RepID=A0A8S1LHL5_9CILI|nr:unnamed protein product [Paramecium sonneborni]
MQNLNINQVLQYGNGESPLYDQYFSEHDNHESQIVPEQSNDLQWNSEKQLETSIQEEQQSISNIPFQQEIAISSQISQIIKRRLDQNYWQKEMEKSLEKSLMEEQLQEPIFDIIEKESRLGQQQLFFVTQDIRVICQATKEERKGYLKFIHRLIYSFQFNKIELAQDLILNFYFSAWNRENWKKNRISDNLTNREQILTKKSFASSSLDLEITKMHAQNRVNICQSYYGCVNNSRLYQIKKEVQLVEALRKKQNHRTTFQASADQYYFFYFRSQTFVSISLSISTDSIFIFFLLIFLLLLSIICDLLNCIYQKFSFNLNSVYTLKFRYFLRFIIINRSTKVIVPQAIRKCQSACILAIIVTINQPFTACSVVKQIDENPSMSYEDAFKITPAIVIHGDLIVQVLEEEAFQ